MACSMLLVSQLNINPHYSSSFVGLVTPAVLPPVVWHGERFCGAGAFATQPMRRGRKCVRNAR
jgi:hypothetical protein